MRYPIKRSYTVAALDADGWANDVTGAEWTITGTGQGDGLAHLVTVLNNTANSHTAKTITLTGLDADGNTITESMAGPDGSSTVTSTKAYRTLTSAAPSATIGEDTFDIGWSAVAVSPTIDMDKHKENFSASVAVVVGGTINYDLRHVYEDGADAAEFVKQDDKTASTESQYTTPIHGVRVRVNSHTSGTFDIIALQGEK